MGAVREGGKLGEPEGFGAGSLVQEESRVEVEDGMRYNAGRPGGGDGRVITDAHEGFLRTKPRERRALTLMSALGLTGGKCDGRYSFTDDVWPCAVQMFCYLRTHNVMAHSCLLLLRTHRGALQAFQCAANMEQQWADGCGPLLW